MITPERRAELEAELDELLGPPPLPKPKIVTSDRYGPRGVVIRDADVAVSPADRRNSRYGTIEVVSVRRPDCVTIDLALAESQYWDRLHTEAANRPPGKDVDPMGVWRRHDD